MQHIMNDFVLAFFEQYLNNTGTGIDKPLRDRYPEVLDVDVSHVKEWAASDPKPIFMSHTHVFKMNRLLAASSEVEAETAKLDRRYVMAFKLEEGDKNHWWQTIFDPKEGLRFSLLPPEMTPDLTLEGDYVEYIRFMNRLAAGEATVEEQPGLYFDGLEQAGVTELFITVTRDVVITFMKLITLSALDCVMTSKVRAFNSRYPA